MSNNARVQQRPDLVKNQRTGAVLKTSAALAQEKRGKRFERQVIEQQHDIEQLNSKVDQILALLTKDQ